MSSQIPLLPRTSPEPDNLQRLRERASERMRLDETIAVAPVSRRWALGRLALVAAAMTPVAGALLQGQRAMAEVGPRSTAPQYGAPPYPAPRPAPTPAPPAENPPAGPAPATAPPAAPPPAADDTAAKKKKKKKTPPQPDPAPAPPPSATARA